LAAFLFLLAPTAAPAQTSVESFYRSKPLTIFVPSGAGGVNDTAARLVGKHLPRFIPGAPKTIVENVPGAGGLTLANRLFNTLEKDGSVISALERGTPQTAIQGDANARFDPAKITWLGSLSSYGDDAYLLTVHQRHEARTLADLQRPGKPVKIGTSGPGATNRTVPLIGKELFGLNLELVRGYTGAPQIFLAMFNGEIDAQIIGLSPLRGQQLAAWRDGVFRPLLAFGRRERHPDLPDTPIAWELVKDAESRQLLDFTEMPFFMALPFAAPPGLPADRADALRTGFMAMAHDGEFRREALAAQLDVTPVDHVYVTNLIVEAMKTPKSVVERYTRVVGAH
jgi:tripartite-type tricarboxylate transporter receptor subunit TctC